MNDQGSRAGGLGLVMFSGGYDRVHYALAMAAAAAASGRQVSILITGRALLALGAESQSESKPGHSYGWHDLDAADDGQSPADRDGSLASRGVATFEELLAACAALDVSITVCEMGLRALDWPVSASRLDGMARLRDDIPTTLGGIVGFLGAVGDGALLFI